MPTIVSREDANLPQVPSFIDHRSPSSWAGIRIHHTGGSFSTWRAVHDWQTEGRDEEDQLAYIGYSFGIADGQVTELRGFRHHPAHDFINTHLGVVFGGNYQNRLPTRADLDALVWFIGEAERVCGKRLPISTHREVGQTACPGDELHRWVKATLPDQLKEDDDMSWDQRLTVPGWFAEHFPGNFSEGEATARLFLTAGYGYSRLAYRQQEELVAGQAAIMARIDGQDDGATRQAVRQELDRHRQLQAEQRQAEHAELAELVRQGQSGEVAAEEVVRLIGERLTAVEPAGDGGGE